MKIGMQTDSLYYTPFDEALDIAGAAGLDCLEFSTGGWSIGPHFELDRYFESEQARKEFLAKVADCGLSISALCCNGNQLDPGPRGATDAAVVKKTIELAPLMGVDCIVLMSGCPGGPGDKHPNWVVAPGMPEVHELLRWQWEESLIPYWRDLVAHARNAGVTKLALEMHPHQMVFNAPTLLQLRDIIGPEVGANFDPSHLMWMGADPLEVIPVLGDAIFHVHAKDTRIEPRNVRIAGRLDPRPRSEIADRAWSYVTLGYGNDESFWRAFCMALRTAGYDDVLSIEHEDESMEPVEAIHKSVDLLSRVMPRNPVG